MHRLTYKSSSHKKFFPLDWIGKSHNDRFPVKMDLVRNQRHVFWLILTVSVRKYPFSNKQNNFQSCHDIPVPSTIATK